ncbi:MAG: hypothetical protein KUG77_24325 [Nannocystaceae bacterium]|nr:hypothetical protein [Nannocystaceae bacterium]
MNQDALFSHPEADRARLRRTHELVRVEVTHEPAMSFGLLKPLAMAAAIPSAFEPVARGVPEPLAAFGLPPSLTGPRLGVSGHTLEWEVDPLQWLRWLAAKSGWRVALAKTHVCRGGPGYELAALRERDGEVVVRRTMAVRSGPRLVRCDACAPHRIWSQWHDPLWFALESFYLGHPRRGPVEELVLRGGPLVGFAMPGSWDARGDGDDAGMSWALQPVRDVQRGAALLLRASPLAAAVSAEQRRRALWRELADTEATLGAVRSAARPGFGELVPGWVGQWQAALQSPGGEGVAVLAQREHEGIALDYVLTAPAAGTDHLDWMRATRALDVVISTSQPRPPKHR